MQNDLYLAVDRAEFRALSTILWIKCLQMLVTCEDVTLQIIFFLFE